MNDDEYPREWARRAKMTKAARLALRAALVVVVVVVVGTVVVSWLHSPVSASCFDTIWEKGTTVACMDPRQRATKAIDGSTICVCEKER